MTIEITCPECNFSKTISKDRIPSGTRFVICPQCRKRFEFVDSNPDFVLSEKQQEYLNSSRSRIESPWEDRSITGSWKGIYRTFHAVLFSPKQLFRSMSYNSGIKEPFAFGLLAGSIGTMISLFWYFLNISAKTFNLPSGIAVELPINLIFISVLIIIPFMITILIFISSIVIHLFLVITRGAKNGFEGTFRVLSFSQATQILAVIPVLGGLLAFFWNLVVLFIGLREIHETSYTRVFFAILIPALLITLILTASFSSTSGIY